VYELFFSYLSLYGGGHSGGGGGFAKAPRSV
jgi:hypothetical protein